MKYSILFFLSIFAITISSAQDYAAINAGTGWPFIFNGSTNSSSSNYSIGSNSLNVFIEKSGLFKLPKSNNFYITPGINYFLFHESGEGGGLGGRNSKKLKHQALSLYAKLIYGIDLNPTNSPNIYFGVMSGVYIFSKTSGERAWWAMYNNQNRSGTEQIDTNGKHFFNSSYMGFLFGFKPVANPSSFIQPLVEFSFFPNYAVFYNPHISENEQKLTKGMAMISVAIGLNPKKKE